MWMDQRYRGDGPDVSGSWKNMSGFNDYKLAWGDCLLPRPSFSISFISSHQMLVFLLFLICYERKVTYVQFRQQIHPSKSRGKPLFRLLSYIYNCFFPSKFFRPVTSYCLGLLTSDISCIYIDLRRETFSYYRSINYRVPISVLNILAYLLC